MLAKKVHVLRFSGVSAIALADFWDKLIAEQGEAKATAFYSSLGLNHLHTKSAVVWEGLTLSREPKDHEKLCVKGVSEAQDAGKASVSAILLKLRLELISDAVKAIKKLSPATYHELILTVPDEFRIELGDQLAKIYRKGRRLVANELGKTKAIGDDDDDDPDELNDLTDISNIRVANEIQARITGAAARFTLLGLTGAALWGAVEKEVGDGSTGWLERIATGAANKVLNVGRGDEMRVRAEDIDRYEQSELLDQNTCGPCAEDDGKTASDPDDLPGAPNPNCEGQDLCRGFVVAIAL